MLQVQNNVADCNHRPVTKSVLNIYLAHVCNVLASINSLELLFRKETLSLQLTYQTNKASDDLTADLQKLTESNQFEQVILIFFFFSATLLHGQNNLEHYENPEG